MKNTTSNTKKTPDLRFPEYNTEWVENKFKDLTKINQGLQIPIADRLTKKIEGSYFYITNEFLKKDSTKKYYITNPNHSVICNKTDILMTRTGNTGQVVTDVKGVFHNNFFKIQYDPSLNKSFLKTFLKLPKTQRTILRLAGTSTIPDLNHGDFYNIKIQYPSLEEQQKIATFLTSVDNKIEQLTKKKKLLEEYKKGVIQKIFNKEVRFRDDNKNLFPEWKRVQMSTTVDEINNKTNKNNQFPILSSTKKGIFLQTNYFNKQTASKNNIGYKILNKGSFTYRSMSDTGNFTFNYQNIIDTGIVSPAYPVFNNKKDIMDKTFLYYFLNFSPFIKKQILQLKEGGTRYALSFTKFKKLKVLLPHIKEQQKIASFLTSIDNKIDQENFQLRNLKMFKKGLLEKMFI